MKKSARGSDCKKIIPFVNCQYYALNYHSKNMVTILYTVVQNVFSFCHHLKKNSCIKTQKTEG